LPRKKLELLLAKCARLSDSMWLIPRSGDFITEGVDIEIIGDVLSLYIKKNLAKPWNIAIKNLYETILTFLFVCLFLPLFVVIAIAIRLDSKGPVFYIQERIGKGKSIFRLFKFRSMYVDNEMRLVAYLKENPLARKEWDKYKKLKNHDPRVTPIGKFLRRFSLDELPQLFNVLQGSMSLVGPRPYLPKELEGKDTFKSVIALVKPGITGLWQISGRSELSFAKRISLDEYYIRNWSVWLDVTILLKSLKVWLSQKGAY
jgi:undecaprenyl-phosphate galactose phosphotransferase